VASPAAAEGTPAADVASPAAAGGTPAAAPTAAAAAGGAPAAASAAAPAARAVTAARRRYRHWWWLPGWIFAAITQLPALLVIAWLLPGFALLVAGRLSPIPMLLIFVPLAAALCYFALRQVPVSWPRFQGGPRRGPASRRPDVPLDVLILTVVIAAGFAAWQLAMNSQEIIVLRDPGSYLQFGYWIAKHGSSRIPQSLAAFGGRQPGLSFYSIGFYQAGTTITPQFTAGLPIILAAGVWLGGVPGALVLAPIAGACAVLAFAGLAGRLAGPRWAPAAALVLALTLPEQYTSRATFSEPLTQVLLFGGLCMIIDSLVVSRRRHGTASSRVREGLWQAMTLAAFGGLAMGLTVLVGIGGLSDLLPVLPFLVIMIVARRPQGVPLAIGLAVGIAYGLVDGYVLSRPWVDSLGFLLRPFGLVAAGFAVVTAAVLVPLAFPSVRARARRFLAVRPLLRVPGLGGLRALRRLPGLSGLPGLWKLARQAPLRWLNRLRGPWTFGPLPSLAQALPWVAAALPVAALIGFTIRPYLQIVRGETNPVIISYIAGLQRIAHLTPDGHRQYYEDTLYWVIWYLGVPAVLLAVAGLALLSRRCLRALLTWQDRTGAARIWALPLMIIGWGTLTVLWDPAIVPDQPWASRRLVPVVLPGLIAAGVWVSSRLKSRAEELGASRLTAAAVASCCVLAMAIPVAVTTLGVGLTSASQGRRPTTHGLGFKRTSTGESVAVSGLCAAIGTDASVVIVDTVTADEFSQVVRGMCNMPTGRMDGAPAGDVQHVIAAIERTGRHPVLLGSSTTQLSVFGGTPREVLDLQTTQDQHLLTSPPTTTWPIRYTVWLTAPAGTTAPVSQAAGYWQEPNENWHPLR
jgi:hypothetical protein